MTNLLEFSWLIPAIPMGGALLVGVLLISFSRTINRLTKPVSWLLIACIFFSTVYSFAAFKSNLVGDIISVDFLSENLGHNVQFYIDNKSSLFSMISGIAELIIMIASYLLLDRKQGYVRFFVFIAFFSSITFSFLLSGEFFQSIF